MEARSHSKKPALKRSIGAGAMFLASFFGAHAPALAGSFYHDHAYADSYGNLVIYSPAGYKAIVVGKGYLAPKLAAASEKTTHVARGQAVPGAVYYLADHCARSAVLLHGRSYMYGLPENVVPVPADEYCGR